MKLEQKNRFLNTSSKANVFQSSFVKNPSNKLVRGGMPLFAMKPDTSPGMQNLPEAAQKQFLRRQSNIQVLGQKLMSSLEEAREAEKGSSEARVAWDTVEEIEAAISHYRQANDNLICSEVDIDKIKAEIDQVK